MWLAAAALLLAGGGPAARGQDTDAEVDEVASPAVAAQSLRLDRLLTDPAATRPATLSGPVWTFEPQPGRELVVLPIAVDPEASGVTLDDPAFSVQAARFVGWVLPDEAADTGRGSVNAGPTDDELLDLGRLLAARADDASAALETADAEAVLDASDIVPEGAPRATRSLELLPGGRVAWTADRSLPGTVQASASPPTAADVYRLKLDPEQVRTMKPERPDRLARTAGEDRRTYDLRVREANELYRSQSEAFRTLTDAIRALPERFEARRPAVVLAVFEANASGDLILRGHPAGRWAVSRDDLDTLGRLATAGGALSGGGGAAAVGLTTEQAADVATLARVASDRHPWAQRAAALALSGSGYLAAAGPAANDAVGGVARRLLASEDAVARNRTVYALARLESATPAVASLLASASSGAGDPAVDAAAVRARLAVEVAGGAGVDAGRGATVDLPAVGRVVTAANQMLQAADGPDAGAVVRELLLATGDASSGGRGGGNAAGDVEAALIGGVSFAGLPPARFAAAAAAVMESTDLYPAVAGGWLNRQLLGSADRGQVEQTLDLLNAVSEPSPLVGPLAAGLRGLVLGRGGGEAAAGPAGRKPRLTGGLPLDSANHALFRVLSSGDPALRQKGWRALRHFALPGGGNGGQAAAADGDPGMLLDAVLSAALSRATTPESLVPFLTNQSTRQAETGPLGTAVTGALVRVTAEGDTRSARRAARALLGSERRVAAALDTLDPGARARFAARLYDRLAGSLSPVTGLIRADGSTLTRFLGEALAQGGLPDAAAWARAAGSEETLYGHATGSDDALARAAIAGLAALAGADTPKQLAAAAAFEGRRRGMRPEEFGEAWTRVRQVIFTARLADAAGDYRLVVTLRGRRPATADGGGLASDPVLGTDPAAYGGYSDYGGDGDDGGTGDDGPRDAEHEERFVLGVVELVADGGTVRLGAGTPEITVPDDYLAIRLPSPGDLKNLEKEELQDLPLERIDGALDLLPIGNGVWSGGADLADGRRFELRLEPHGR